MNNTRVYVAEDVKVMANGFTSKKQNAKMGWQQQQNVDIYAQLLEDGEIKSWTHTCVCLRVQLGERKKTVAHKDIPSNNYVVSGE